MITCFTFAHSGCNSSIRCLLWYQPALVAGSSGAWAIAFIIQNAVTDDGLTSLDFSSSKHFWVFLACANMSFVIIDLKNGLSFRHKTPTSDTEAMKTINVFHFKTLAQCYTVIKLAFGILPVIFLVWSLSTAPEKPTLQEMHHYMRKCKAIKLNAETVQQYEFATKECLDPECKIEAQIGDKNHVIHSKYYGTSALVCDTDKLENVNYKHVYLNVKDRTEKEKKYWPWNKLQTMDTLMRVKGSEYQDNRQKTIKRIFTFCMVYVTTAFGFLTLAWCLEANNFGKISAETEQQLQSINNVASLCAGISQMIIIIYVYGQMKTLTTLLFILFLMICLFIREYENSESELTAKDKNGSTPSTTKICRRMFAVVFTPTIFLLVLVLFLFWNYDGVNVLSEFVMETKESLTKDSIALLIRGLVFSVPLLFTLKGFGNQAKN